MGRLFAVVMVAAFVAGRGSMGWAQSSSAALMAASGARSNAGNTPDLPPLPQGISTILGGEIYRLDPVMDEFQLKVYGEKPMKIFFDERTEVYRDGKRIPLHDLGPATHASVQTMLDGTNVFAASIHILSTQPQGEYEGRVLSYDAGTGVLNLTTEPNRPAFRLVVSSRTTFKRVGQGAFSSAASGPADLAPGSLVQVKFDSNNRGQGVVTEVSVLAAPGASFVFSGTIAELNLAAGTLAVVDPRDNQSYQISFDAHAEISQRLSIGEHVRIAADYNGEKYVATGITIE